MSLPKVTIATVCFNAEATLERTIQSVLALTYPNIEYLVIDGKSTDGTLAIAEKYSAHIDQLVSEKDRNNYDAMNKAMKLATGDYIWFLHAGDNAFAADTLDKAMEGHKDEDFVYGKVQIVTETGEEVPFHKEYPAPEKLTWKSFRNGMVVNHQAMLVHRRVWVDYDLTYGLVADLDWSIRLMKKVETVRDTGIIFCTFLAGGISSKHRKQSLKERFWILRKHFGLIPTLWEHVLITLKAIKRGNMGSH